MEALGGAEELLVVQFLERRLRRLPAVLLGRVRRVAHGTRRRQQLLVDRGRVSPPRRSPPTRESTSSVRAGQPIRVQAASSRSSPRAKTWSKPIPLTAGDRHRLHRSGRRGLLAAGRLDPGLGDRAQVLDEAAGRAVGLAPCPGGRQLGQPCQPEQPLGDLGLGGEEALAAQPDALDQPPHEDVGAPLLERRRGGPVEPQEDADPFPRLGLELGTVERRLAAGDHVELAPAGDRRQPRQVAGAQLDRRPGQRPRRRRRVVGVGEHPQPGDRVAHLGPLEERRRPGQVEGDAALLHRRGDGAALAAGIGEEDADRGRCGAGGEQVLDLARHRLRLRTLVRALPEPQLGISEPVSEHRPLALRVNVPIPVHKPRVARGGVRERTHPPARRSPPPRQDPRPCGPSSSSAKT